MSQVGRSPAGRPPLRVLRPGEEGFQPAPRRWWRTAILVLLGLIMAIGLVTAIGLAVTPPVRDLPERVDLTLASHHATRVPLAAVPDQLSEALIAIEDERFYEHHGIDTQGLIRAVFSDLYHHRLVQGASTLSQQLVKNLYLQGNDDGTRKLEDVFLTLKVEAAYSKHTILEDYLNTAYFGHGAWGIGQAAQVYFHMAPSQLDLARDAMLAGLPQAPSTYDLYLHPCQSRARQFAVLAQLAHDGYISQEDAARAYQEPIGFPCQ